MKNISAYIWRALKLMIFPLVNHQLIFAYVFNKIFPQNLSAQILYYYDVNVSFHKFADILDNALA